MLIDAGSLVDLKCESSPALRETVLRMEDDCLTFQANYFRSGADFS